MVLAEALLWAGALGAGASAAKLWRVSATGGELVGSLLFGLVPPVLTFPPSYSLPSRGEAHILTPAKLTHAHLHTKRVEAEVEVGVGVEVEVQPRTLSCSRCRPAQ